MLSTRSATALYVGAFLGPGVLLLPALAARIAGPASVLAWEMELRRSEQDTALDEASASS